MIGRAQLQLSRQARARADNSRSDACCPGPRGLGFAGDNHKLGSLRTCYNCISEEEL